MDDAMGVDLSGYNFLLYCSGLKSFGKSATLGRQHLFVPLLRSKYGNFCESMLLKECAASSVESLDISDYEGATRTADFNLPIEISESFDTVIDLGTTEHIFNIAQALKNTAQLCSLGGQIIHVSPANNFCGHGFFQFSPELFFSLYSPQQGFSDTEVFLTRRDSPEWFKVKPPSNGQRVEVHSSDPLYIMCRTVKTGEAISSVQQSDYVNEWQTPPTFKERKSVAWLKTHPVLYSAAYNLFQSLSTVRKGYRTGLNNRNPNLERVLAQ